MMIKKLLTVTTLALLTTACAGPLCQSRGCNVVLSDSAAKNAPVLFDFDSAKLTAAGESALAPYAEYLNNNAKKTATIAGYTDDRGDATYNLDLSQRRANAAKDYLVKKGVAANRLKTVGYGETNFVADNASAEGRAQNRRIELEFN